MTLSHRTSGRSPRLIYLLIAGLIAISLSSISCHQIGDPVNSVSLRDAGQTVSDCIAKCNADAALRVLQQTKVHNIYIFLCKGNPTCVAGENARYVAALQSIETDRLACIAQCHHQGGATAGR
jgi:hypothetical protein